MNKIKAFLSNHKKTLIKGVIGYFTVAGISLAIYYVMEKNNTNDLNHNTNDLNHNTNDLKELQSSIAKVSFSLVSLSDPQYNITLKNETINVKKLVMDLNELQNKLSPNFSKSYEFSFCWSS